MLCHCFWQPTAVISEVKTVHVCSAAAASRWQLRRSRARGIITGLITNRQEVCCCSSRAAFYAATAYQIQCYCCHGMATAVSWLAACKALFSWFIEGSAVGRFCVATMRSCEC